MLPIQGKGNKSMRKIKENMNRLAVKGYMKGMQAKAKIAIFALTFIEISLAFNGICKIRHCNILPFLTEGMGWTISICPTLHADQYMTVGGGGSMVGTLSDILLGFGVSLVILKFLKKGFECYVLWTDGDPDNEPIALVIRFVQAVASPPENVHVAA